MKLLQQAILILTGALLAIAVMYTGGAALADGPAFGPSILAGDSMDAMGMGGMHMGGMHMDGMHMDGMMGGHGHGGAMHDGAMPEECEAMMDDPDMMRHMMQMMHGDESMEPEECQTWMDEHDMPAEHQDECLEHMAEHAMP
jgi:hypothetical protein